jgi:outer membrane receptor protein involved in Fe transport
MKVYFSVLILLVAVFVLGTAAEPLVAQTGTVTLTGAITDSGGAIVPGVSITATNVETGIARTAISNEVGIYTVRNLPPGTYDVNVSLTQFAPVVRRNQTFNVGATVTLDFTLSIASANEVINVSEEAPVIDTSESVLARVIQTKEIDNLPSLNRSFTDLAALSPGVITSGGGLQIGNSQSYQTGFVLDGNSYAGILSGGQAISVAQDWIQEFSVNTSQFSAEFGGASGGVVNAVTRSGTNSLHGRGYGFFQDSSMNAPSWTIPPAPRTSLPFSQQRFGGDLGGPIKSSKLFYFIGYEKLLNTTTRTVSIPATFTRADASNGSFPSDTNQNLGLLRLDYQLDSKNTLTFRSNGEYTTITNSGVGGTRTLGNSTNTTNRNYTLNGSWTSTFNANWVNDARFGYLVTRGNSICNYVTITGAAVGNPTGGWAQQSYPNATLGCSSNWGSAHNAQEQFYDSVMYDRGKHQIKFGVNAMRSGIHSNTRNNTDGQYTFPTVGGTSVFFDPTTAATFPTAYLVGFSPPPNWSVFPWSYGLYVQDSWRVRPNLTLNGGIRYDIDTAFSALNEYAPAGFHHMQTQKNELAPRLGFAWTPFAENNTVIRGGVGMYFDQNHDNLIGVYMTQTALPLGPGGAAFNLNATRASLNPYCVGNPACAVSVPANLQTALKAVMAYALANKTLPVFPANGGTITVGGNNYTLPAVPTIPGTNTISTGVSANDFDSNFKVPYSYQWSVGMQHSFGQPISASLDYVGVKGFDQVQVRNININQVTLLPINPALQTILSFGNGVFFNSNSLRTRVTVRDHRGDNIQTAYTFAHSYGDGTFGLSSRSTAAANPFDYMADYGPNTNDIHHVLNVSGTMNLKWGISLAPLFSATSGNPYTATTTAAVPGCPSYYSVCYPTGYTRNSLRGAANYTINARLSKTVHFNDSKSITGFFEAYNVANHANYTGYQANVTSATFQQPTAAAAMRQLQLGVRFDF